MSQGRICMAFVNADTGEIERLRCVVKYEISHHFLIARMEDGSERRFNKHAWKLIDAGVED